MSIWTKISEALETLRRGGSLQDVLETLRTPPERSVAFTIAVIALGAKMAKADGLVTRDEVTAFREIFHIPSQEEQAAARVFDLARKDVAGFEEYANKIAGMFGAEDHTLCDLLEGLFHIAMADGQYHPREDDFLAQVAEIFGIPDISFSRMRARFVPDAKPDPYSVLGVTPETPMAEVRKVWRQLVRETHPDLMIARGVPEEAMRMAEKRMVDVNRAWEEILQAQAQSA